MGVISLGNEVSFAVSKSNKELIAVIKDMAYKRITENVLPEYAFKKFINTYGEDIGKLDAFCQRDESIIGRVWMKRRYIQWKFTSGMVIKFITSKITMPEETRGLYQYRVLSATVIYSG